MWQCPECNEIIDKLRYYERATKFGYVELIPPTNNNEERQDILDNYEDEETQGDGDPEFECTYCENKIPLGEVYWIYPDGRTETWNTINLRHRRNRLGNASVRIQSVDPIETRRLQSNNLENNEVIIPENTINQEPKNIFEVTIKCQNKRCNRKYIYLEEGDFAECPHCGFNNDLAQHRQQIINQSYQNKL